jgi:hypothetical protein
MKNFVTSQLNLVMLMLKYLNVIIHSVNNLDVIVHLEVKKKKVFRVKDQDVVEL